jgi:hypothetical protein
MVCRLGSLRNWQQHTSFDSVVCDGFWYLQAHLGLLEQHPKSQSAVAYFCSTGSWRGQDCFLRSHREWTAKTPGWALRLGRNSQQLQRFKRPTLQIQTPSCYKEEALQIAHKSKRETMTHSEAMEILGHLAVKLEMQMRFQEREAIEYAISKLTTPKKDDPNALAQMILDAAKQASDLHAKGLI